MADGVWPEVLIGDVRSVLPSLAPESVHMVCTSPPYHGLRDYGTGTWEGGNPGCDHRQETAHQKQGATSARAGRTNVEAQRNENFHDACGKCGACRIDKQIGLERNVEEWVETLVAVFREVRRVLRKDGTVWLNLGDSYACSPNGRKAADIVNDDRTFRDKPFSSVGRQRYRLRRDLSDEDRAYVLSELSRAAMMAASTEEGDS